MKRTAKSRHRTPRRVAAPGTVATAVAGVCGAAAATALVGALVVGPWEAGAASAAAPAAASLTVSTAATRVAPAWPARGAQVAGAVQAGVPAACGTPTVTVRDAAGLTAALAAARPGAVIGMADGVYRGRFVATAHADDAHPIRLCGSRRAILDGGSASSGYVLHLDGARGWQFVGFTVRNGQKGIMADGASHNLVQDVEVAGTGQEGVHLRRDSTANRLHGLEVHDTGLKTPKFGEGIYVGSAVSNWHLTGGRPDHSDRNVVQACRIWATTAEAFDLKEGTTGGWVLDNLVDGAGTHAVDSVLDAKGNGWTISGNRVAHPPQEVFQVHERVRGWGKGNRFARNSVVAALPPRAGAAPPPRR